MECRSIWGIPVSLFAFILLTILGFVQFVLVIPSALMGLIIGLIAGPTMPWFVEFLYMIPVIGRRHVTLARWYQKVHQGKVSHSRWRDLRIRAEGDVYVHCIPNLTDNYCYLIVGPDMSACVIDPGDATRVLHAITAIENAFYHGQKLSVKAILNTHKHWDHQAGNTRICKTLPSCTAVYCGEEVTPRKLWRHVVDGERIVIGSGLEFTVLAAAGHTRGGVMYSHGVDEMCLFTGDTLFSGGCGAPFEGSEIELLRNFVTIKKLFPPSTLLFPGHEYTQLLIRHGLSEGAWGRVSVGTFFAFCITAYRTFHRRALSEDLPTVPISLAEEYSVNRNFAHVDKAIRTLNACLEEEGTKSDEEQPPGEQALGRTFTMAHASFAHPSHVILDREDWMALKRRYPHDEELLLQMESRPFLEVAENGTPFGSGPVSTVEDVFSVCGVESGSKVLSRERLLWCVRGNERLTQTITALFDEKPELTPKEAAKRLGYGPDSRSCWKRFTACCTSCCRKSKTDDDDEESTKEEREDMPLQSKSAHAIDNCSYCRAQMVGTEYGGTSSLAPKASSRLSVSPMTGGMAARREPVAVSPLNLDVSIF